MEIACEERSRMAPGDFAFVVRAVNEQMRHLCAAWGLEPWPCRAYDTLIGLPSGTFWPLAIMDKIGLPGASGYHDFAAGLSYGRCLVAEPLDGTTLGHEAPEMRINPRVDRWILKPDGVWIAKEVVDPVQEDSYPIPVTIGDETRQIRVSNFVHPNYFDAAAPGPYDHLGTVDKPFGLSRNGGGWRLLRSADGHIYPDFGKHAINHLAMAARATDPFSRTYRLGYRG